jgi:hypothetical protein
LTRTLSSHPQVLAAQLGASERLRVRAPVINQPRRSRHCSSALPPQEAAEAQVSDLEAAAAAAAAENEVRAPVELVQWLLHLCCTAPR